MDSALPAPGPEFSVSISSVFFHLDLEGYLHVFSLPYSPSTKPKFGVGPLDSLRVQSNLGDWHPLFSFPKEAPSVGWVLTWERPACLGPSCGGRAPCQLFLSLSRVPASQTLFCI